MIALKDQQYVVDAQGNRVAVLVDVATYEKLFEALEELEDIRAYDKAKDKVEAELQAGEYTTLEEYNAEREGD
ncbi:MAG: hypothetical protein SVS15_08530 [Thermodesulfobacteriota bacterium]|nr:hypothetical protein [Thermodesulfobacteriota bacterium]